MKPNAFVGKKKAPSAKELGAALGVTHKRWQKLVTELGLEPEWNSYQVKAGWSLKLKQKKRTILYLGPCEGSFRAAFVLGEKAIAAAKSAKLPKRVMKMIGEAKKYPEGWAVRFEEVEDEDLDTILKLGAIKAAN